MTTHCFSRKIRERVGVVIVAAEGAGTIWHRIQAARLHRGITGPLPIAVLRDMGNLSNPADLRALVAKLELIATEFRNRWGVRLGAIVIDTVAAAFSLEDENNNAEAANAIRSMRSIGESLGALVLPVHHHGKSGETGLRGASAWHAGADAVISVLADRNVATGDVSNRSIALAKSRTADEGPILGFDLVFLNLGMDDDDEIFGSCAVTPNGAVVSRRSVRPEARSKVNFRAAFHDALSSHGVVKPDLTGDPGSHAVQLKHVREALGRQFITDDDDPKKRKEAVRRAAARAVRELSGEFATTFDGNAEWIWSK